MSEQIKLPTTFEETIDFLYEVQNMADATEKARVLWPACNAFPDLVKALEEISDPLKLQVEGIGLARTLNLINRMSSIAKDALVRVKGGQGHG
jgi:hypothetical protein